METTKSSMGVELEFLLCIAEYDQPINAPERFQNSGGPLVLPPGVSRNGYLINRVRDRLMGTIDNAISSLPKPGDRVIQSEQETLSDFESLHLRPYQNWSVGTDASVLLPLVIENEEDYVSKYRWYATEIASPALWATDASWDEIKVVVQAIKDEFWIIISPTCGMHFHYGHGKDYIPFQKLRRMAALLIAVDPLMVQLHPEHRRANEYCISNRLYSCVAHGRTAAETSQELGAEYTEAEVELPGYQPRPEAFPRPFRKPHDLIVPFRRGELTGYEFDEEIFRDSIYSADNPKKQAVPLEISLAVSQILQCLNSPTVAELMGTGPLLDNRPAYNFRAYTLDLYKQVVRRRGQVNNDYQNKRTVEFRQMAATMEPEEVVAHGKVIVRLCEYAEEADLSDIWKVVLDCTVAEENSNWFDIFDLLAALGLFSEAKTLQHSVARFRGETIPEGLTVNEEEEEAAAGAGPSGTN
ncbi:hypothetical protein CHU98_g3623 [Xylaria longipes]|nr:hypothetical protein CHU98_g3623 [Xylaria longipes]